MRLRNMYLGNSSFDVDEEKTDLTKQPKKG